GFRRHLGGGDVVGALDEHGGAPWLADSTEWRTVPKPAVAADGSLEWAWARAGARRRLRPYYTDDSHTARASDRGAFPDSCLPPGTGCRVRRTDRQPRACPLSGPSCTLPLASLLPLPPAAGRRVGRHGRSGMREVHAHGKTAGGQRDRRRAARQADRRAGRTAATGAVPVPRAPRVDRRRACAHDDPRLLRCGRGRPLAQAAVRDRG